METAVPSMLHTHLCMLITTKLFSYTLYKQFSCNEIA